MIRILLVLTLIIAILFLPAYFRLSQQRRSKINKLILIGAILLLISRALPGLFGLIIPLLAALIAGLFRLLPVLIRYAPLLQRLWFSFRQQRSSASNDRTAHSTIDTPFLRVQLDQNGQPISGQVLQGKFSGRLIASLDVAELALLIKECASDQQSTDLLLLLIKQNTGSQSSGAGRQYNRTNRMTAQQALKLLGLRTNASRKEIITAHRRLMQKAHPDRGGSVELAAQINEARDVLLNQ